MRSRRRRIGAPFEDMALGVETSADRRGFAAFRASGLHKAIGAATRGTGVILTLHHVRPWRPATPGYAPNRLLEITPEFLDEALGVVRAMGFEFVSLEEAARRLRNRDGAPFAALTFDDGYRDTRDFALPILERHGAPCTVFFATGFIERTARLWWLELEEAVRRLEAVESRTRGIALALGGAHRGGKVDGVRSHLLVAAGAPRVGTARRSGGTGAAGRRFYRRARRPTLHGLGRGLRLREASARQRRRAQPHPPAAGAMAPRGRARGDGGLQGRPRGATGRPVESFAYPVGDPTSAGPREFELAHETGFDCAVTTRPGMLFPAHAQHLTALPRVSLNGLWQDAGHLEVLLSGAPFALWNRGRRVNVA